MGSHTRPSGRRIGRAPPGFVRRHLGAMSEAESEEVEDQQVQCAGLDAGSGSQCFELGEDWVAFLAEADLPDNVTGVDPSIQDFGEQEWANV
jgi:hypothetical protein